MTAQPLRAWEPPGLEGSGPESPKFKVRRIKFEGNSAISTAELRPIAAHFENRQIKFDDLRDLTAEIRAHYRAKGYILAKALVPRQKVEQGGEVLVTISEGRYGDVKIEGNKHHSEEFVMRHLEPAVKNGVVREKPLTRSLMTLNEFPDMNVRTVFEPGKKPGTTDMVVKVTDKAPYHAGVDYNNFGNPTVGEHRVGAAVWAGNLIAEGDDLTARVTFPFPSDSDPLYQAAYTLPIFDHGDKLATSFATTQTVVGGDLAALGLVGSADIYGITWLHPLVRATDASSNMHLGFASKTVENFVLQTTPVSTDEIREVTLGFDTNFVVGRARTLLSGVITQGLGTALGGSDNGAGTSRAFAGNDFSKVNVEGFHIRDLRQNQFLLARLSAQYSDRPLVVAEQFAMGGADSVRGYFQSEFLGDDGYTASLEYRLRLHSGPKLQLQGAMFIDHGDARVKRPQIGEIASKSFTGAGVGMRASVGQSTTLRLDWGFPITEDNQLLSNDVVYGSSVSRW